MIQSIIKSGIYRQYDGKYYCILDILKDIMNNPISIVFEAVSSPGKHLSASLLEWNALVRTNKGYIDRFNFLGSKDDAIAEQTAAEMYNN